MPCSARRSTTTSCPVSGSGCTRRTPRRSARAAPAAPPPSWPATPASRWTSPTALSASIRAGDEASAVGGPDEAAHHYQQALELLADPRRAQEADVDVSKLAVKAAESLTASGHPIRAAALLKEQLDLLPDDAGPAVRARMLSARANVLILIETDEDRVGVSEEAVALVPAEATGLRAKVLVTHARILASMARYEEAQIVGVDGLELAERLDLNELASDAITTLSQLKKSGPKEGLRAALVEAVARAEKSGALNAELRGRWLLGRSYQDWAEFDETEKWFKSAIERGEAAGIPWAPYAFESRWQLTWVAMTRGEWDRVLELADVPGYAPPVSRALLDAVRHGVDVGRGRDVSSELFELRRYWHKEGAIAISSAGLEMVLAGRRNDPAGRARGLRGRRPGDVADLAPVVQRPDPAGGHGPGRPGRRRAVDGGGGPADVRRGRRAAVPRRPHRARALHRPVRLLGARGPGLDEAGGRRAAADALALRRRRAAGRRTRRHLAGDGRAVRGLR